MKRLLIRSFAVTVFVFFIMWFLGKITSIKLFNAFDPISQALGEFELTDYVFSELRPEPLPDPRIVLVNIGPSRGAIAQQIQIINQHNPKVIGMDSFFNCEGGDTLNCPQLTDTLGNLMLSNAIQEAGNVVLVTRLLPSDSISKTAAIDLYDSIEYSDRMFRDYADNAFANLISGATYQEDVKICKSFVPKMTVHGKEELAFAVKIAMLYDSVKTQRFLARNKDEEIINFRGNFEVPDVRIKSMRDKMKNTSGFRILCYAIDWDKILEQDFVPSMFEGSIVIFGFLGNYFGDPAWEDKFFTPLNLKVAGRANPDMFGVVVHANIVAMIINEDYVNEIPEWLQVIIAFLVCMLNVPLLTWVDRKLPAWFDGLSVMIQIAEILIVSGVVVFVFAKFNLKLELALTIGALALVGPCFDIFKSFENTVLKRFTKKEQAVLTT